MNFGKEIDKEIEQAIDDLRDDLVSTYEVMKNNNNYNNLSNLLKKSQMLDKLICEYYNCLE